MVIASFLNWGGDNSGVSTDALGLLGILALLFGLTVAGLAAVEAFSPSTSLPTEIVGISLSKIPVMLGFTMFLWTFGIITRDGSQIGLHLTWISGAIVAVGGVLAMQEDNAATSSI